MSSCQSSVVRKTIAKLDPTFATTSANAILGCGFHWRVCPISCKTDRNRTLEAELSRSQERESQLAVEKQRLQQQGILLEKVSAPDWPAVPDRADNWTGFGRKLLQINAHGCALKQIYFCAFPSRAKPTTSWNWRRFKWSWIKSWPLTKKQWQSSTPTRSTSWCQRRRPIWKQWKVIWLQEFILSEKKEDALVIKKNMNIFCFRALPSK